MLSFGTILSRNSRLFLHLSSSSHSLPFILRTIFFSFPKYVGIFMFIFLGRLKPSSFTIFHSTSSYASSFFRFFISSRCFYVRKFPLPCSLNHKSMLCFGLFVHPLKSIYSKRFISNTQNSARSKRIGFDAHSIENLFAFIRDHPCFCVDALCDHRG